MLTNTSPLYISLIIPSYMEEENLRQIIPRCCHSLSAFSYEILIVDTVLPMDGTPDMCTELQHLGNIKYVARRGGNQYGDAVRTGISEAQGQLTVFMDADGSHAPEFIKKLMKEKTKNNENKIDMVIASRYIDGGQTENSPLLIFMSRIVNIGYSLVLGIKCKDISNSFKLYNTKDLKSLTLQCQNFDIVEEIIYKLVKKYPHYNIKEIPFAFKKRMLGETKRNLLSFMISYFFTLIKLRFIA